MTAYGYAAMNTTLREEDVRTNRGMRQATFETRGLDYVGQLAGENCRGLLRVMRWNVEHDIRFYRITSDLLPWFSQYDIDDLPNADEVRALLAEVGDVADRHGVRLTFHPDHFVKLASPDESVLERSLTDLENHGALTDAIGLDRSPYNAINIHIGAHYGDKAATAARFCEAVDRLSPAVRSRLTVENDDTPTLWSVSELVESVADEVGVPVTYDEFHHQFTDRGRTFAEAATLAATTWDETPIFHYSESKRLHTGDTSIRPQKHSEYVDGPIRTYGTDADVMIEATGKERAVLAYRDRI